MSAEKTRTEADVQHSKCAVILIWIVSVIFWNKASALNIDDLVYCNSKLLPV